MFLYQEDFQIFCSTIFPETEAKVGLLTFPRNPITLKRIQFKSAIIECLLCLSYYLGKFSSRMPFSFRNKINLPIFFTIFLQLSV